MSNALQIIDKTVHESAGKFASTLTQYKWDLLPDSQLQAAKAALTKNDYIMTVAAGDPGAVHDALIKSAILGLDLTEGKRQAWLVPRKTQRKDGNGKYITAIQLQVGYKGVEAIHQRMGVIDRLVIRTVRENDAFEWSGDDQEKPQHKADWFASEETRGPIVGVYSITYFPEGSFQVMTASVEEIYKNHRARSDSWKSYIAKKDKGEYAHPPPWVTDEKAMIEKTMAYIASKQWPANTRNQEVSSKILETLHEIDMADYSRYTLEQKEAFDTFLEMGDGLGLRLMEQSMDVEVWAELFNSFPKGEKTKMKQKVRELTKEGHAQFDEILDGLGDNDPAKVLENLDGCSEMTPRLVRRYLGDEHKVAFDDILKMDPAIEQQTEAV